MNYLEIKTSEATDDLRYRLHRLTLENLQPDNAASIIIPQPEIIRGLLTSYHDEFTLTANMSGVIEEWYRRGIITGMSLKGDCDLRQDFDNRNQQLHESFKEWVIKESDRLAL